VEVIASEPRKEEMHRKVSLTSRSSWPEHPNVTLRKVALPVSRELVSMAAAAPSQ
jgi:hypothetical protein